jgi:hypothetical protein
LVQAFVVQDGADAGVGKAWLQAKSIDAEKAVIG